MRVFVTGATGFVGSAVVKELLGAGHGVIGLARSDSAAKALAAAGAEVHRGSLEDPDSLRRGADMAEGVIHCAFIHDFSKFRENCEIDVRAITAMSDALRGSGRPLVVTSGTGFAATEDDRPPRDHAIPRVATEYAVEAQVERGVNASTLRLPQVHGEGDRGFVPRLIAIAREKGVAAYIGEGKNRWPAVHRSDAAALYRLALEKGAAGRRYHAVADEGVTLRAVTEIIGRRLNLPVASKGAQEAAQHFGWFAAFATADMPSTSARTRAAFGWEPRGIGLLADLDHAYYFEA